MKILYFSQYFPPEAGATQTRAYEMARTWVNLGHNVTMIAEVPNHPSGIISPAFRGKLFAVDDLDGIHVIRVWVFASPVKNFRTRMLFYLTYMFNAVLAGIFLARSRFDMIYASSPPLFVGAAALFVHWLRRIPLVFEVRDLWPESAIALGELKGKRAIQLATKLEETCYRQAKHIVVVTEGIFNHLVARGLEAGKLLLIPNGANVDLFQFSKEMRQEIRKRYDWQDRFVVMYAGIHGLAQGLETVVKAARAMQAHPQFQFVLVGSGPQKTAIQALVHEYGLRNLVMLDEQPREHMPAFLSAADVILIPLRKLDLFKSALPSKLFDAWSCERPVLLSVDGEARRILDSCQGGWFVPPEDPVALTKVLLDLPSLPPGEIQAMGKQGRSMTVSMYDRQALARRLSDILADDFEKNRH